MSPNLHTPGKTVKPTTPPWCAGDYLPYSTQICGHPGVGEENECPFQDYICFLGTHYLSLNKVIN